jgi:hypothetical protein
VQKLATTLLHLKGALVAFFKGALETWDHFTSEFASDGNIANMTNSKHHQAWMKLTNDDNEGGLGEKRQSMHQACSKHDH